MVWADVLVLSIPVLVPPDDGKLNFAGKTVSCDTAAGAFWLTVTVWVIPPPVNVTVPLLEDDPELAVQAIETAPLPVPDAGLAVIQLWLSVTFHDTFEVTDAFLVSPAAV